MLYVAITNRWLSRANAWANWVAAITHWSSAHPEVDKRWLGALLQYTDNETTLAASVIMY